MTTATVTRSKTKKVVRKKRATNHSTNETKINKCSGGTKACENCRVESETLKVKKATKKKKPMYKLCSWHGLFKGTLDF